MGQFAESFLPVAARPLILPAIRSQEDMAIRSVCPRDCFKLKGTRSIAPYDVRNRFSELHANLPPLKHPGYSLIWGKSDANQKELTPAE